MAVETSMHIQAAKVVPALAPQTMAGAADGDWVSMKGYDRVGIEIYITQGNAATTAITVDAATSVAGANLNAGITMNNWWYIADLAIGTDAGVNSDTWVKGAAAATITSSNTGTGASMYYIEVDADDFLSGTSALVAATARWDCIQVKLGASNIGNIASVVYHMGPSRYAQAVSPTPSAIID